VGLVDPVTRRIQPVAASGAVGQYLDQLNISAEDVPEGRGPTGQAVRLGQHFICRDIEHEDNMLPWRAPALALGYRSSAAFPLSMEGAVIGAYTVYASEPGWFSDDEVQLLDELAADISYALEYLAKDRRRQQAEFDLQERLKEMTCLAGVRHDISVGRPVEELCQRIVEFLVPAMQFPELALPILELDDRLYTARGGLPETAARLQKDIMVQGTRRGQLAVGYLDDTGFLLPYEQDLLDGIVVELSLYLEQKLAEENFRASQERYRLIVETASEGILAFDQHWQVRFVNPIGARLVGYEPAEMVGMSIRDFIFEADVPGQADRLAAAELGLTLNREGVFRTKSGQPIWLQISASPILQAGQFAGCYVMITDINARKQAELQLARLYRASGGLLNEPSLDLQELAQSTLQIVASEFGQTNSSIFILQEESNNLLRVAAGNYVEKVATIGLSLDGPGLVPLAIRTGQVIHTPNVAENPHYLNGWDEARSELTIPLKVRDRVIGCIDLQSVQLGAFSEDDIRLLTNFADRAALVLEHGRLYSQMEQTLENLTALRAIDNAITGTFDLNLALGVLLDQIRQRLGVDTAQVWVYQPATFTFKSITPSKIVSENRSGLRLGDSYPGQVVLDRQTLAIADLNARTYNSRDTEELLRLGYSAYLGVPLLARGQVKGVLEICQRGPLALDQEQLRFTELVAGQAAIAIDNSQLFENLQSSNLELQLAYDTTIEGWSLAMDLRDKETEGHTLRVTELTMKLARAAGLTEEQLVQVRRGALLHDIGKLGVPDNVLLKPGQLTDEEWVLMRMHPTFAYKMIAPIAYLRPALDIPYCHHEKWDGSGYPRRLKGEEIPLAARLFSVVDVWDALRSDRPYRQSWPPQKVLEHIRSLSGTHFEPKAVELFLQLMANEQESN
jgi:PAS domain S-box-containing protein